MSEADNRISSMRAALLEIQNAYRDLWRDQEDQKLDREELRNRVELNWAAYARMNHEGNVAAGWWSDPKTGERIERNIPEMIALAHSEIAEAQDGSETGDMDDKLPHRKMCEVELADLVIRVGDTTGGLFPDTAKELGRLMLDAPNYNSPEYEFDPDNETFGQGHRHLSRALQYLRKPKLGNPATHFACAVLWAFDMADLYEYDIVEAIIEKTEYNASRPDHKPANRAIGEGAAF